MDDGEANSSLMLGAWKPLLFATCITATIPLHFERQSHLTIAVFVSSKQSVCVLNHAIA